MPSEITCNQNHANGSNAIPKNKLNDSSHVSTKTTGVLRATYYYQTQRRMLLVLKLFQDFSTALSAQSQKLPFTAYLVDRKFFMCQYLAVTLLWCRLSSARIGSNLY